MVEMKWLKRAENMWIKIKRSKPENEERKWPKKKKKE